MIVHRKMFCLSRNFPLVRDGKCFPFTLLSVCKNGGPYLFLQGLQNVVFFLVDVFVCIFPEQ